MRLMRTTTIVIDAPIDPAPLDARFTLIRYEVPASFRFQAMNDKHAFARLHNDVRAQRWQPYRFFTHDTLGKSPYAIYVLYDKADSDAASKPLTLPSQRRADLPRQSVSFGAIPHHLVVKLLQAHYFGQDETPRFTSQGKHFLLASGRDRSFIGLEIELKGAKANNQASGPQVYQVIGRATRFARADRDKLTSEAIRKKEFVQRLAPRGGQILLSAVPMDKVRTCPNPIFTIERDIHTRPKLHYHDQGNYKESRGYLLYTFIIAFIDYLAGFGIDATQEYRDFTQHRVDARATELTLSEGMPICVLDQRLNRIGVPFDNYLTGLSQAFRQYNFVAISDPQESNRRPTLIIQDVVAETFAEGGVLAGQADPYQELYRDPEMHGWPRQWICVNTNDPNTSPSPSHYLTYPPCDFTERNGFLLRFRVCLNQLMLKEMVLSGLPLQNRLPFIAGDVSLQPYVFVRRQTFKGVSYTVLLSFEGGRAQFLNLNSPDDKVQRDALLKRLGLDWSQDVIGPWREKHCWSKDEETLRAPYHFILGQGMVVEVEDCQEQVLYEYDVIAARQAVPDELLPIATFKLAPHYDRLRTNGMASLTNVMAAMRCGGDRASLKKSLQVGAIFYEQLQAVDAFLDELAAYRREMSFNAFTGGENGDRLTAIFFPEGIGERAPTDEDEDAGSRVRRRMLRLYQRLGMFPSSKASDVQSYHGIWVDDEGRFMVGSPDQLKFTQPRAHLIRRFDAYQGGEQFPTTLFLNTLAVQFVRPEQYTVYPYPFHFIDLYIETKLHWEGTDPVSAEVDMAAD